jgi:hypothetical protein
MQQCLPAQHRYLMHFWHGKRRLLQLEYAYTYMTATTYPGRLDLNSFGSAPLLFLAN